MEDVRTKFRLIIYSLFSTVNFYAKCSTEWPRPQKQIYHDLVVGIVLYSMTTPQMISILESYPTGLCVVYTSLSKYIANGGSRCVWGVDFVSYFCSLPKALSFLHHSHNVWNIQTGTLLMARLEISIPHCGATHRCLNLSKMNMKLCRHMPFAFQYVNASNTCVFACFWSLEK